MLVPLYGFLEGDTIGLLVLAHDDMTVGQVADKLCASAAIRVVHDGEMRVVFRERVLDPVLTVNQAGLTALDRIDVRRRR